MTEPAKLNYALAFDSAVVYVARALDKAAPAALSVEELTRDYDHAVGADLNRVKRHEGLETDLDAKQWIIRRAIASLGNGVELVDDHVIIANGHRFEDLRFRGKPLERAAPDIHAVLRDPFNPMSGKFSDNIREETKDPGKDTAWDELRESLRTHGWVPEFPALVDERGVVLVGNRRRALAKELGLPEPWPTQVLHIGKGDAADARRLRIAIVSNIASKRLSPNDRKRIAAYLYGDHEWSQQRVADALGVAQITISEDLRELKVTVNSKRGRPRGKSATERLDTMVHKTTEVDEKVHPLLEEGKTREEISKEVGVTKRDVENSMQRLVGQKRAKHTCPKCGFKFDV